jgi:tetratricopeptide (TPR) repeat protein
VLCVRWVVVVALLGGFWCGRAGAESAEGQVERLASDAVNAYKGADYNRAVELLQRAYEIRQVPALLYNMAKAYDKLGDVEHAYETYRRYADSADADPKLKAKAESRLVFLEEARRKKAATARSMEPRSEPRPAQVEPPRPAQVEAPKEPPPPTADQIRDKLRVERMRERKRDRYIALGLGVGAVAFAGVAIGLSVNALSLQDQWSGQYGGDEAARRTLRNDAQLRAGLADGFYGLTAVAAGVSAYFLYRGFRPEPTAPSLALLPVASPQGGALVVAGTF